MTEANETFRMAKRGYEPTQVDERFRELTEQAAAADRRASEMAEMVSKLEAERDVAAEHVGPQEPPGFEHLGERVGQILSLAETEAAELRKSAKEEMDAERARVAEETGRIRAEADRYAEGRREKRKHRT